MGAFPRSETGEFAKRLRAALDRLPIEDWTRRRVVVALSGGLDSTLLLHVLAGIQREGPLIAVHVDHSLHADSADWAAHCERLAAALGIALIRRQVTVEPVGGVSLEAAARKARYAVLAECLEPGDLLLTAHHGDDQLETLLLRLMRGTGVRGLAGIHEFTALAGAWMARPLLEFSRAEIEAEARRRRLRWLEDPSNRNRRFDRNYLRAEIVPRLRARWPAAHTVARRLAQQAADADALLEELAAGDLAGEDPGCLSIARLAALSPVRRANALRSAIRACGLEPPSAAQLATLQDALTARNDAVPAVVFGQAEARVYRGRLYLLDAREARQASPRPGRVSVAMPWTGTSDRLELAPVSDHGIPDDWARAGLDVRFRAGGERFRPQGHEEHKTLKHWFQEQGIVPWMRARVPLLFHDDRLVAIADLALSADLPPAAAGGQLWRPCWIDHERLH